MVWYEIKQILRNNLQRTLPELKAKIEQIWDASAPEQYRMLISSMPNPVRAVIKFEGDVTSF